MTRPYDGLLESAAIPSDLPPDADMVTVQIASLSIAISLKRIADGLDGAPELIRLAIYNGITDGLHAASLRR